MAHDGHRNLQTLVFKLNGRALQRPTPGTRRYRKTVRTVGVKVFIGPLSSFGPWGARGTRKAKHKIFSLVGEGPGGPGNHSKPYRTTSAYAVWNGFPGLRCIQKSIIQYKNIHIYIIILYYSRVFHFSCRDPPPAPDDTVRPFAQWASRNSLAP